MKASDQLEDRPAPQSKTAEPKGLDAVIAGMDRWHAVFAGALGAVTAAINLIVFVEQQWQLAAATLGLLAIGVALYFIAYRRESLRGSSKRLRYVATGLLLATIPTVLAVFFSLTMLPRLYEHGPIIAIARFEGPRLPPPYDNCRPSDMLADALTDVSNRFHRITAFEVPYIVDPNGRWAGTWAVWHGLLEGADVMVYGEYTLVDSSLGSNKPDRVLISPQVSDAPMVSLGWKRAPLVEWQFPDRLVPIDQLCTGTAARFVNDGRRLGLALAASELFANQQYTGAMRALHEAEQADARSGCAEPAGTTECSGVLAFYLATLEQRSGHYHRAKREYVLAARTLTSASPYINLGGLYAIMCDGQNALEAARAAVEAEPSSVAALATLAQYENEYGDERQSIVFLERAESLRVHDTYDEIALSRALHQRAATNLKRRGIAMLDGALGRRTMHTSTMNDTRVELASWWRADGEPDHAISQLSEVLRLQPDHIKANYELALALRAKQAMVPGDAQTDRSRYATLIARQFVKTLAGRAFTDDDFTNQANAAFELHEDGRARALYAQAIAINGNAVYAFWGRAALYERMHQYDHAVRDVKIALALHPREAMLQSELHDLLRTKPPSRLAKTISHIGDGARALQANVARGVIIAR